MIPADQEGLDQLYRDFAPAAQLRARQLLGNTEEAWDVVHDVFCRIVDRRVTLRRAEAMAFLYTAVTNGCLNRLKERRTHGRAGVSFPADEAELLPPEAVVARDLLAKLWSNLTDLDRQIIVLRYYDELPQEEIARVLGKWRRQIGRRLTHVRQLAADLSVPMPQEAGE